MNQPLSSHPVVQYKIRPPLTPMFVGRVDYLQRIGAFFAQPLANARRRKAFLLHGIGGVGKTQICLKFIEEYASL